MTSNFWKDCYVHLLFKEIPMYGIEYNIRIVSNFDGTQTLRYLQQKKDKLYRAVKWDMTTFKINLQGMRLSYEIDNDKT